ncbi:unnamed protein product [Didymodactylos carnosus]|uniref:Luc7-like protein 3 n=1 Tax=Didymodactylos carnosus TaxID=1234261 RepID=A0A813RY60_9BILA|nr:unnamed protein product [Didymodactylos carnosus]CAF3571757.1 unnamed protein product [Didymodactylos carnosus]
MGKARNATAGETVHQYRFDDPEVCKYLLVEFCPHDLFVNTRADLGPCDKVHEEGLQKTYLKSSRYGKLGYEEDFERFLKSLLADVERRIKRGIDRLRLTQGESVNDNSETSDGKATDPASRIRQIDDRINELVQKSEQLGCKGKVDEAQAVLEECEQLRAEREQLSYQEYNSDMMKAMEVCNVCGSFLIVGDAQCRIEEHVSGKQHVGYAKIRSTLEELQKKRSQLLEKDRGGDGSATATPSTTEKERLHRSSREERHKREHSPSRDEKFKHQHLSTTNKHIKTHSRSPSHHHSSKKHHRSSETKEERCSRTVVSNVKHYHDDGHHSSHKSKTHNSPPSSHHHRQHHHHHHHEKEASNGRKSSSSHKDKKERRKHADVKLFTCPYNKMTTQPTIEDVSSTIISTTKEIPSIKRRRGAVSSKSFQEECITPYKKEIVQKDYATMQALTAAIKKNILFRYFSMDLVNVLLKTQHSKTNTGLHLQSFG